MKWSRPQSFAAAVIVAAAALAGCATDNPRTEAPECAVNTDCPDEQSCTADGRCVYLTDDTCADDAECTEVPEPTCEGDELITYAASCEGTELLTCNYPQQERVTCEYGCDEGACNPDPCDTTVCDSPPQAYCEDDAETLVTYADAGTCSEGDCSYAPSSQSCVFGCSDGACNEGACDATVCDTPPPPKCDGNTGMVYADTGECVENEGSATCLYDVTFNNCDYVGGTCDSATGTCTNALTQVGGVVIVEYMADPVGMWDGSGEWFEVVNTSGAPIDLTDWTIVSGTSGSTIEEHLIAGGDVPAFPDGARLLFTRGSDPAGDGSVMPDYEYDTVQLNNTSDWIKLVNPQGELVDYVYWEPALVMDGNARKYTGDDISASANDDFALWCPELGAEFGGLSNFGTPKTANPACAAAPCDAYTCSKPESFCNDSGDAVQFMAEDANCQVSRFANPYCDWQPTEVDCADAEYCLDGACSDVPGQLPQPGDVIFTEFMGNPSGSDSDGEYLELYNTTDQELSLFTLTIRDNESGGSLDSFVIEDPTATIPAKGYAVFASNTDATANGGIAGAFELVDSPLKNSPGASGLVITLELRDGTVVDDAYYGEPTEGASQQLSVDAYTGSAGSAAAANDSDANFCPATAADPAYTSGDLGSPGAANEGCP